MEMSHCVVFVLVLFQIVTYADSRYFFDHIKNMFDPVQHESVPAKVINSFLLPFRGSSEVEGSDFDLDQASTHRTSKAWWDNTSETPIIQNIFNQPPTTKPNNDKIDSQRDSQTQTNIAVKIKEFKDQEKQGGHDTVVNNQQTPKPADPIDPKSDNKTLNCSGESKSKEFTPDGKKIMHAITKKHFYFQAGAVRPEGTREMNNETIYYVDD